MGGYFLETTLHDFDLYTLFDSFQEISFSSPVFLILVLAIIALMTVGIPLYAQICKLRAHITATQNKLNILGPLYSQAADGRCGWTEDSQDVYFTELFAKVLGLNPNHPITLTEIQTRLSQQDSLIFSQALQTLILEGTEFTHTVRLRGGNYNITLSGKQNKLGSTKLYQLIARDTMAEEQMIDEYTTKIRQLMQERDTLSLLVDMAPVALWFRDEEGKIKYCNKIYASYLESSVAEVVHKSKELIPASRMGSPYQLSIKARTTGLKQQQRTHIVVEGQRKYFEIIESAPTDQDSSIGYAIDLTETEDMKTELNRHVRSHHDLLQHLSTPLAYFGADTTLQLFNQAYVKLYDLDETWLYTKPTLGEILEILRKTRKIPEYTDFPKFKTERLDFFRTLMEPFEELLHRPDGQVVRVMIAPHPLGGLLYLFDDITETLTLERKYNTLMAVQKQTLDQLYEGLTVFGSDHKLRLSNPAAGRIWHLSDEDRQPGCHLSEILKKIGPFFQNKHEWERLQRRLTQLFTDRQEKSGHILQTNECVIRYTYVPLPDGSHMVTFVDVSDSWRIANALKERNSALERVDRLKTDFISHVSYELKAPLNSVLGFAEILSNQYFGPLNEKQADYCKGIVESSERLLTLINDILDLANIEAGTLSIRKRTIKLNDFMDKAINLVHNRANDQGLEVLQKNETQLSEFTADEPRLKQAIFNLLTNAVKFTPSGGQITLRATVSSDQQGFDYLNFIVEDTGVGISQEDQAKIFDMFEKASVKKQTLQSGAGIGLTLVKSLIELHGGSITIRSEQDKGTQVTCKIPLFTKEVEETAPENLHPPQDEESLPQDTPPLSPSTPTLQ